MLIRKNKMCKKAFCFLFAFLLSINSFAAVVSDNDGSAFITKAEFDSLKNDFQKQIDQYNSSIDSKIDSAIASYLSGLTLSQQRQLSLDIKCNYDFPLVCFFGLNKAAWNDEHSDYYRVSLPQFIYRNYRTDVSRLLSDRGIENDVDYMVNPAGGGPYSIPTNHLTSSAQWLGIRCAWGCNKIDYPGRMGTLYRIDKDATATRNVGGANHKVWNLRDIIYGQDNLYYFSGSAAAPYDGSNATYYPWLDFCYMGYYERAPYYTYPYNNWQTVTEGNNDDAWSEASLRSSKTHSRPQNPKAESNHNHNAWTTYADATTCWMAWTTSYTNVSPYPATVVNQDFVNAPDVRVLNAVNSGHNQMIFAGDACMPTYNDGGFSLAPRKRASTAAGTKVTYKTDYYRQREKLYYWNFYSSAQNAGPYTDLFYVIFPEWHVTPKNSFEQDSSNRFSMIRASLVRYQDSNGKDHYMDEGMYLGTYEDDGRVTWIMRVGSTAVSNVNFAVSKKPIDANASSSDYPAFSWTAGSTKTDVAAGTTVQIPTNQDVKIEVPGISKGDQLYMIWWPSGTEYVELTKFDDYYIYTE